MNNKIYTTPELEIVVFESEDVITASVGLVTNESDMGKWLS